MSSPHVPPPAPNQPQTVYVAVPKPAGLLSRLVTLILGLTFAFFVIIMLAAIFAPNTLVDDTENKVDERYHSLDKTALQKVVIIEVTGVISDADEVRKQCLKARDDEQVKAVVLRVDSPGGTVFASDQMYHYLRELRKDREIPLVVSMGGIAASGGYYISMAVGEQKDVIFAEPTTWTGSIGVLIPRYTVAGLMEKLAIEDETVKSAPLKGIMSPTKKMTPEEEAVLEGLIKESFTRFKEIVESGRPKLKGDAATMAKATTGQVFSTKQALELGLVDREGFLDDAIDRAIELAGLKRDSTKVVKYKRPKTFTDMLLGARGPSRPALDLQQFLDLTTPRAYYLFAWPHAAE